MGDEGERGNMCMHADMCMCIKKLKGKLRKMS